MHPGDNRKCLVLGNNHSHWINKTANVNITLNFKTTHPTERELFMRRDYLGAIYKGSF